MMHTYWLKCGISSDLPECISTTIDTDAQVRAGTGIQIPDVDRLTTQAKI
jgi:hypothetical protein